MILANNICTNDFTQHLLAKNNNNNNLKVHLGYHHANDSGKYINGVDTGGVVAAASSCPLCSFNLEATTELS